MSGMLRMDEAALKALLARGTVSAVRSNTPWRDEAQPVSKYRAKPTETDGIRFHSKKEARHWQTLRAFEIAGKISDLARQTEFSLDVNGAHLCRYICDFTYKQDGKLVAEDVKGLKRGVAYDHFKLKAKLMQAIYGIIVVEI